jgi:hypothetical protein
MANKTSANQGSSGEQEPGTPRVSRKVIGKTSAPYERKDGAAGGEEKKPGSEGEQAAAAEPGAQAEGQPAPEAAGAEASPDQGKSEGRAANRKEAGSRREVRTTSEQAPAAPAGEPAAAPRVEQAAPTPPAAAPAAAPSAEQAPVPAPDPEAEFEELLKPNQIQRWDPGTAAAPPIKAPPGDSRSFRRRGDGGEEFVLIYRVGSILIRRAGRVGVMGTWTLTEYPHIGSAAHAYAQQCSDLVHAGFRDLR